MYDEEAQLHSNIEDAARSFMSSTKLSDRARKAGIKFSIYQQIDTVNKAILRLQRLVEAFEICDGMDDINELPGFCHNYPFKHSLDEMGTMWADLDKDQQAEYNSLQFQALKERRRKLGDKKYIKDGEVYEEPESEDYRRGFSDGEERAREHYTGEIRTSD